MAYNPKNPPGKNSPESMALFGGYSAEAFKAAKGLDVSSAALEKLTKGAESLTEASRRKIVLSGGNIRAMAKSITALDVAAQSLRANPKDVASIVTLKKTIGQVERFGEILSAAGVSMPKTLSNARFSALGHVNQLTQGRPVGMTLDKMLKVAEKEQKQNDERLKLEKSKGPLAHLKDIVAAHSLGGRLSVKAMDTGFGFGGMGGAAVRALGFAGLTAGAVVKAPGALQDLQKGLVEKGQPFTDYMQSVAQVSRFGGGRSMMNMPYELKYMEGQATEQGNLSTLLPSFTATNGLSPAMMQALAQTGIPVRNLSEGRRVLRTIYGEQASGGPMGGLGIDQLTGITKQLYGLGLATRGGGNMVNTQAASVTNSIYGTAMQTGISEGFDKSTVAQSIQDSLETMAKQGGVAAGLPSGLFSLFAGGRGMTPGVAAPSSVTSSLQGLTEAGSNIVSRPGLMVGLQNFVMGSHNVKGKAVANYKGKTLSDKIMSMGKPGTQLGVFTRKYAKAIQQSPGLALAAMSEAGLLTDVLPASLNSMFGGGQGDANALMRAFAATGSLGQTFSQALQLNNVHTRISGGAGGLDDHTKEMMRLHGVMEKNPKIQALMKMSPGAQSAYLMAHRNDKDLQGFFSSSVFGGPAGSANPFMGAISGRVMTAQPTLANPSGTYLTQTNARGAAMNAILSAVQSTNRRNASMMADQAQNNLSVEEQRGQAGTLTNADLATGESNVAGAQGLDTVTAQNWLTATRPMVKLLSDINDKLQAIVKNTQ